MLNGPVNVKVRQGAQTARRKSPSDGSADLGAYEMEAHDAQRIHEAAEVVDQTVEGPGVFPRHGGDGPGKGLLPNRSLLQSPAIPNPLLRLRGRTRHRPQSRGHERGCNESLTAAYRLIIGCSMLRQVRLV